MLTLKMCKPKLLMLEPSNVACKVRQTAFGEAPFSFGVRTNGQVAVFELFVFVPWAGPHS